MKPTPPGASDMRPSPQRSRTPPPPSFRTTKQDASLIRDIVERATRVPGLTAPVDRMELSVDITACHLNGCPLRLADLLAADDANFGHDVFGIRRFIDRTTGKMDPGKFWPRFAKPRAQVIVEDGTDA